VAEPFKEAKAADFFCKPFGQPRNLDHVYFHSLQRLRLGVSREDYISENFLTASTCHLLSLKKMGRFFAFLVLRRGSLYDNFLPRVSDASSRAWPWEKEKAECTGMHSALRVCKVHLVPHAKGKPGRGFICYITAFEFFNYIPMQKILQVSVRRFAFDVVFNLFWRNHYEQNLFLSRKIR